MTVRIGVDTGGTFTDVVLHDEATGETVVTKTASTPGAFEEGVLTGIDEIGARADLDPADVGFLSHGTTVGTNAILEGDLPDLGLLTNEGLRDVVEIGDQTRPDLYDLYTDKPPTLVPRALRKGVPGRIDAEGREVEPLDEDRVDRAIDELLEEGVDGLVVVTLFSYLDDGHERRIGDRIEERDADLDYALSSAVHPEIREYDRTVTTVLNEAVKSRVGPYLARLEEGVEGRGIATPLNVMHSGGGIFGVDAARENALRTVLSGPAAGAVATRRVSEGEGLGDAIGMDIGGTSADISIVRDGELVRTTEAEIDDLPIKTPMIDVTTVGAGGGSVAWIDDGGALRVGPKSAGADPGPVCYDRGGSEPTLTDANLLLGRIDPDAFLGGEMALATDRARRRVAEVLADPLGASVEEAALSVVEVANASLVRQIRTVTVEQGHDPRTFALVAFGGAGPLQAAAVGREMRMDAVVVPRTPGVFSARGLLVADVRMDELHAYRADSLRVDALREGFDELVADVVGRFRDRDREEVTLQRSLDVRYEGQSYELTIPVTGEVTPDTIDAVVERFHATHERRYGHAMRSEPIEAVTLRVSGVVGTGDVAEAPTSGSGTALTGEREVYFGERGFVPTDVYDRYALDTGAGIDGPAILQEAGSTALVPPDAVATVSDAGNVIVDL